MTKRPRKKKRVGHSMLARAPREAAVSPAAWPSPPRAPPWPAPAPRPDGRRTPRSSPIRIGTVRSSSSRSSIERRASSSSTRLRACGATWSCDLYARYNKPVTATNDTAAIGARFTMKSVKVRSVAPAMMMFGGSPINVAVPPMLEAITSMITSGIGSISRASASRNVIGTTSRIVVRLSRNADRDRGRDGERRDDGERPATRQLPCADRNPGVDAGGFGQLDHDHHAREQSDRVEVDRLYGVLLVDHLRDQHEHGPEQRDLGAVDPLARDQGQRGHEDQDRQGHQGVSSEESPTWVTEGRRPSRRISPKISLQARSFTARCGPSGSSHSSSIIQFQ